jgi:hypothetical protein
MLRINMLSAKSVIFISTLPILGAICALAMVQVWRADRIQDQLRHTEVELAACQVKVSDNVAASTTMRTCVNGVLMLQSELATILRMAQYER